MCITRFHPDLAKHHLDIRAEGYLVSLPAGNDNSQVILELRTRVYHIVKTAPRESWTRGVEDNSEFETIVATLPNSVVGNIVGRDGPVLQL